jgi:hypothetical protein
MRDPTTWAIPLFRLFGARVKLHALYLLSFLLFFRFALDGTPGVRTIDVFAFVVLLPLPLLLVHELGHLFAARMLGGDAPELVIAPLGGIVPPEVNGPRAKTAVALAGPLASGLVCVVLTSISVGSGYAPLVSPFANPFACPSTHAPTGRVATTDAAPRYYRPGSAERVGNPKFADDGAATDPEAPDVVLERATLPTGIAWLWRANWLGIWLVLFNLCVWSVPLDAGRVVQAYAEARHPDPFKAAVLAARFSILVCVPFLFVYAVVENEALLLVLGIVILAANAKAVTGAASASRQEAEDKPFGYDFSEGYSSLEGAADGDEPAPSRPGFFERRRRAREAERLRKEAEQDQKDAERLDILLEKIQRGGTASLTEEERAFLDKTSLKFRERS